MSLFDIGRSGLMAAQSRLNVTGHNIANVNTDGYSRQVVEQRSQDGIYIGNFNYGSGTYVSDVKRVYNEYAHRELRLNQSTLSYAQTALAKQNELDEIFSTVGQGVPSSLTDFYTALNAVADIPNDIGMRTNLILSAEQLTDNFNALHNNLDRQITQVNSQLSGTVNHINDIAIELAHINQELQKGVEQNFTLLDRQTALLQELTQYGDVSVIALEEGGSSVMFGGSVMLVSSTFPAELSMVNGEPDPKQTRLQADLHGNKISLDGSRFNGELGALHDYRDNNLIPAMDELGLMALGIMDAFNTAQAQGLDLNGDIGSNLFTDINEKALTERRSFAYDKNQGSAYVTVEINDVSALAADSYQLHYDASVGYQLKNHRTGQVELLTIDAADPNRLNSAQGFSIQTDALANLQDGDKFDIRPSIDAAHEIKSLIKQPQQIAATAGVFANSQPEQGVMLTNIDRTDPNFAANFSSDVTIDITNGTFSALDDLGNPVVGTLSGEPLSGSVFGVSFSLKQPLLDGASFTIDVTGGSGDNRNIKRMTDVSGAKIMRDGQSSIMDIYQEAKSTVGSNTYSAAIAVDTAQSMFDQAYARVESESGVNLDEEAADLMRFQQAYQASARVMTTASELFDTLFMSLR
ncbi:flagellar hook-associated protein FlgK [Paraferrimonas sp. SM1919]|uniref:flagellar hook-associated protein FlgK n=1 Tax=Paraferrimonas sp. SM1919 TaxID=2662263 RepID=UPI0013D4B000|nr:flagellar hook-associated protein FlgK [Paraferrimonas sp. SM1919]